MAIQRRRQASPLIPNSLFTACRCTVQKGTHGLGRAAGLRVHGADRWSIGPGICPFGFNAYRLGTAPTPGPSDLSQPVVVVGTYGAVMVAATTSGWPFARD
ncbi:unnamed protein product [Clonostachys solani]|uniref:Uncharacterized protein n=1 Tax=Clonostachys solani TaxID=160281 RepID=A0A9N9ZE11_9HYPO|nr:unnamed protein product [Clonostachys solani]